MSINRISDVIRGKRWDWIGHDPRQDRENDSTVTLKPEKKEQQSNLKPHDKSGEAGERQEQ